jgi:hypothetical protein
LQAVSQDTGAALGPHAQALVHALRTGLDQAGSPDIARDLIRTITAVARKYPGALLADFQVRRAQRCGQY